MNTTMKMSIFAMNTPMWSSPAPIELAGSLMPGRVQPPKNSVTIMADDASMLMYSAM